MECCKNGCSLRKFDPIKGQNKEDLIKSKISFEVNDILVSGYAYMNIRGKTIESLWLFTYRKGFYDAYIEYFGDNINALRI